MTRNGDPFYFVPFTTELVASIASLVKLPNVRLNEKVQKVEWIILVFLFVQNARDVSATYSTLTHNTPERTCPQIFTSSTKNTELPTALQNSI